MTRFLVFLLFPCMAFAGHHAKHRRHYAYSRSTSAPCPYEDSSALRLIFCSPLVVQLHTEGYTPEPVVLTSPSEGISFDLLHLPNEKQRISWFTPESAQRNALLTLPGKDGVVNADQLFGNTTVGPDGRTESNGFEALRKWDENHDGAIDALDPVFKSLRLWTDANVDGEAQPEELQTLADANVVRIYLAYNLTFPQVDDQYKNYVAFPSQVVTDDGKVHPIYDLWFQIDRRQNRHLLDGLKSAIKGAFGGTNGTEN